MKQLSIRSFNFHRHCSSTASFFNQPNLNKFLELGRPAWKEARSLLQKLLSEVRGMDIVTETDDDMYFIWTILFNLWGIIFSLIQYVVPLPTIIQMYREGTTLNQQPTMYVVALFCATIWLYCSIPVHAVSGICINALGFVIRLSYIGVFTRYATIEGRRQTRKLLAIYVVVCVSILLISIFAFGGLVRTRVIVTISICSFINIVKEALRCILANKEHNSTEGGQRIEHNSIEGGQRTEHNSIEGGQGWSVEEDLVRSARESSFGERGEGEDDEPEDGSTEGSDEETSSDDGETSAADTGVPGVGTSDTTISSKEGKEMKSNQNKSHAQRLTS